MRLSVLDLAPIPRGAGAPQAMRNMLELARLADGLGYHRYWVAEHHGSPRLAASAPEVLIPAIAGVTPRIRVGSGALLVPYHSPLKVVEICSTLTSLYPGRIDLGLGRGLGIEEGHRAALSRPGYQPPDLDDQILDILAFLSGGFPDGHPLVAVAPTPPVAELPEVWLLGSSRRTASLAADLGLPLAYALFLKHEDAPASFRTYREQFTGDAWLKQPAAIAAVEVVCAETEEGAQQAAFAPDDDPAFATKPGLFVGTPERVAAALGELAAATGVDEIMVTTLIDDHAARLVSYRLLAEALLERQ